MVTKHKPLKSLIFNAGPIDHYGFRYLMLHMLKEYASDQELTLMNDCWPLRFMVNGIFLRTYL